MPHVSNRVIDLIECSIGGRTADAVGASFFRSLHAFGAVAFNARGYPAGAGPLGEHIFFRLAPETFMPVYEEQRFYTDNPLPVQARRIVQPFRWSDIGWHNPGAVWVRETMRDCGCPDGLIVPCHGPDQYLGVLSIAFDNLSAVSPAERAAIELAAHALHARMYHLSQPAQPNIATTLTVRERDCLRFVADGYSDGQIAALLGVSRATVATHLVNARNKLGAKTRAQAVALMLTSNFVI